MDWFYNPPNDSIDMVMTENAKAWLKGLNYYIDSNDLAMERFDPIQILKIGIEYSKMSRLYPAAAYLDYSLGSLKGSLAEQPENKDLAVLIDTCYGYLISIAHSISPPQSMRFMLERDELRNKYGMESYGIPERRQAMTYLGNLESVSDVLKQY